MRYKGMVARCEYTASVGVYVGEIINCPDVVSFSAGDMTSLKLVMSKAVDNYLEFKKRSLEKERDVSITSYAETTPV